MKTYQQFNESIKDWWNKGYKDRIPDEDTASWKTLFKDDQAQKGMDSDNYKKGGKPNPFGRPDRSILGRDLNPRSPEFLKRVKADKGGFGSGPTPLVRQIGNRAAKPVVKLVKKFRGKGQTHPQNKGS